MRKLQSNKLVFDIMYGNGCECGVQAFKNKSSVDFSIKQTEKAVGVQSVLLILKLV